MNFSIGDNVSVLIDYDFIHNCKVLKVNKKTLKVKIPPFCGCIEYTKNFSYDKVANEDEMICIVWEMYKGINGRGAYRIERNLYPNFQTLASKWPFQKWIWEKEYGIGEMR